MRENEHVVELAISNLIFFSELETLINFHFIVSSIITFNNFFRNGEITNNKDVGAKVPTEIGFCSKMIIIIRKVRLIVSKKAVNNMFCHMFGFIIISSEIYLPSHLFEEKTITFARKQL